MRTSGLALLVIASVLVLGAVLAVTRWCSGPAPGSEAARPERGAPGPNALASGSQAREVVPVSAPVVAEASPQPEPETTAEEPEETGSAPTEVGGRERIPDSVFERKYAGFAAEELVEARDRVLQEYEGLKKEAFKGRWDAGLYERVGEVGKPIEMTRTSKDPLFQGRTLAGSEEVQMVELPFDEYPEIYELKDEVFWLTRHAK